MIVKEFAQYLLSLPEETQNQPALVKATLFLSPDKKDERHIKIHSPISTYEVTPENVFSTRHGFIRQSQLQDLYNLYRAEVAAGIIQENAGAEEFNPANCEVYFRKDQLIINLVETQLEEAVLSQIMHRGISFPMGESPGKDSALEDYALKYIELALVLKEALSTGKFPHRPELLAGIKTAIESRRTLGLTVEKNLLSLIKSLNHQEPVLVGSSNNFPPATYEDKYHFIIGMLLAALEYKDIPEESRFMEGIRYILKDNVAAANEQELLDRLSPPMKPAG